MNNSNEIFEIYYPSPYFEWAFDLVTWIIFLISTILFSGLFYAVIKRSPKEMGTYKWYLAINISCIYMIEIFIGLFHPRLVLPKVAVLFGIVTNA